MCRWLAYSGSPVSLEDLLFKPQNSLVVQSKHSRLGAETTNGDGFGVGWYGTLETPGIFRSTEPAWNDRNLRELSAHSRSGRVFAHIRASTGSAVQQTNCHPFRNGRWLWMHNGSIAGFRALKRDLVLAVDPELYPDIEGSTDSELLFYLALTFGLADDPPTAVARAVHLVEETGRRLPLPQHRCLHPQAAVPGQPTAPGPVRGCQARRVRAFGRPGRSMARGARGHLPHRPRRPRGDGALLALGVPSPELRRGPAGSVGATGRRRGALSSAAPSVVPGLVTRRMWRITRPRSCSMAAPASAR